MKDQNSNEYKIFEIVPSESGTGSMYSGFRPGSLELQGFGF